MLGSNASYIHFAHWPFWHVHTAMTHVAVIHTVLKFGVRDFWYVISIAQCSKLKIRFNNIAYKLPEESCIVAVASSCHATLDVYEASR